MTGLMWTSEMSDPSGWTRDAQVTAQELGNPLDTSDRTIRRWREMGLRFDDDGKTSLYRALYWRFTGMGKTRLGEVSWDRQMIAFIKIARSFGVTMELWDWEVHKRILVEEEEEDDPYAEEMARQRDYENELIEEEEEALRLWYIENGVDLETTYEFAPSESELRERRIEELEVENEALKEEVEALKSEIKTLKAKPTEKPRSKPGAKPTRSAKPAD